MAIAKNMRCGWHSQSVRHSNARKYGRAGGCYAGTRFDTMRKELHLKPVEQLKYNKNELSMGVKVEMEHTTDKALAKVIAQQHLAENPSYYSDLKRAEKLLNRKYGTTIPPPPLNSANVLPVQVSTIVPSTEKDQKISNQEYNKRIIETKKQFDEAFGGDTSIKETGSYLMDNQLIEEKGTIIESSTTTDEYLKNINKIADYIEQKGKDWKQDTMLLKVEGTTFITPKKEYIPSEKENEMIEVR